MLAYAGWTAGETHARPVSYAGGTMVMAEHDGQSSALNLDYSPTARYAVGVRQEYFRDEGTHLSTVHLNWLAKRWNNPDSQGNFYLMTGAGIAYDGDTTRPAGWIAGSIDWEDRRFFTQYEIKAWRVAGQKNMIGHSMSHMARVGIAPYIGSAGDVHTWVMIQADRDNGNDNAVSVTPLVRVFKGATLGEVGYNIKTDKLLLNLTHTF
jgi:hypothetical protein